MASSTSSISPTTLDAWEQEIRMEDLTAQVMAANEKQEMLARERDAAQLEVAKLKVNINYYDLRVMKMSCKHFIIHRNS